MWATPAGTRCLLPCENKLVRQAIFQLYEELRYVDEESGELILGVPLFDHTSYPTKIFTLYYIYQHMRNPDLEAPTTAAWSDSTVNAIYRYIKMMVAQNNGESWRWRKWVGAALGEAGLRDDRIPDTDAPAKEWIEKVEWWYENCFGYPEDWENAERVMDMDPKLAAEFREALRLPDNYFSEPFPLVMQGKYLKAIEFFENELANDRPGGAFA